MEDRIRGSIFRSRAVHSLSLSFVLALLGALAPQQFPVDLGYLFEVILHLVVVLDPAADLPHFLGGNDPTGRSPRPERDRQIPDGPMPLPFGTLASGVAGGDIALYQRSAQNLSNRWKLFGQTLSAPAGAPVWEAAPVLYLLLSECASYTSKPVVWFFHKRVCGPLAGKLPVPSPA